MDLFGNETTPDRLTGTYQLTGGKQMYEFAVIAKAKELGWKQKEPYPLHMTVELAELYLLKTIGTL